MLHSTTPQQQRSVSDSFSTHDNPFQSNPESSNAVTGSLRRKGSFSFLRRSKSRERSVSGGSTPPTKLSKKERTRAREQEMRHEQIPSPPPRIPFVPHPPDLQTFGGEETRPDSVAIMSNRAAGSFQSRLAQKASQETIGSDMYRGMSVPPVPPIPPIPGTVTTPSYVDAFSRSESMANRGRYSYASSAISTINSPRKLRRRKDPAPFNILVVGAKSSGKTSFLNFLRSSLALPPSKLRQQSLHDDYNILSPTLAAFPTFTPQFVETEIERERIGVTLWDSEGLEANVVDLQVKDIATFIESKFEDTFNEESKVARAPGFRDTQIHCVFLVLDPGRLDANIAAGQRANEINGVKAKANSFVKGRPGRSAGGLDEDLDLNVLRGLKGKTTLVPVISKADTITSAHMAHLKRAVWDSLKANGFETLEAISQEEEDSETYSETSEATELDEGDKYATKNEDDKFSMSSVLDSPSGSSSSFSASDFDVAKPGKQSKVLPARTPSSPTVPSTSLPLEAPALPLSIISPDPYEADVVGRRFPWGFADPTNVEHCDFMKLKQAVFTEWRDDLKEASRERWYERWRTSRLNKKTRRDGGLVGDISSRDWAR